ncbi:hypothetical protein [Streptomyces sp. GQFP]|uniref:hypothetical protein n=1 Tax=Streptomyces sp. GQFP TaxID=2907545 RepID=UPI001F3239AB|nr:hypothetical protein [Streptomyces sp. GQFP]UIX34193.1 hypothetical protein LUX31_31655 [Streptomyces sp. GQFP]
MTVDSPDTRVTPWTLNGLVLPPDDTFPDGLTIAGRRRPVYVTEFAPLGRYRSVALVGDVSGLSGPEPARTLARSWVEPLRTAVETARTPYPGAAR